MVYLIIGVPESLLPQTCIFKDKAPALDGNENLLKGNIVDVQLEKSGKISMNQVTREDNGRSGGRIYHERQSRQLCALHALNNLFQSPNAFSKHDLDAICKELAPDARIFNPHRSVLGFGCYDVNVIISALAKKGYDVIWFDKRKDASCLVLQEIIGFILNVPNTPSYGSFASPLNYIPAQAHIWSSEKHWIAVRKVGDHYYNLDSKLILPMCLGDENQLLQYIRQNSSIEQVEILVIVTKSVSDDQRWIKK